MADAQTLLRWWEAAQNARANFDTYFTDTARYVWPNHQHFNSDVSPGVQNNQQVFDDTPAGNSLKYAAVLETLCSRRSTRWHKMAAQDRNLKKAPRVRAFFRDVEDELFSARQARGAGCYSALAQCYRSEGVLGNDAIFIDDRIDRVTGQKSGIRYRAIPVRDCWITRDWQDEVNRTFRRYPMPAGELEKRFKKERIPERWLKKAAEKPLEIATLLTVIYPNEKYQPGNVFSKPWAVAEMFPEEKVLLDDREDGYDELPLIFTSGERAPWEDYGRGWAMDVLPTIKTLNELIRIMLRAADKQADPPLLIRDDGVLGVSSAVRIRPGGLTRGGLDENGRPAVVPLYTGANVGIAIELLEYFQKKLDRRALVDLFTLLVERPQMTAAEILERSAEKGMFVGPIIGTHQEQKLAPMVDRETGILARQGRLPEMAPELLEAGGTYELEYETPAQQLQRAGEVASIEQALSSLIPMGEIDPRAVEVVDFEKTARRLLELRGYPGDCIRNEREVARAIEVRTRSAAAAEAVDALPQVAKGAKDLAEAGGKMRENRAA